MRYITLVLFAAATLLMSDVRAGDQLPLVKILPEFGDEAVFGSSIAINGNFLIVGAPANQQTTALPPPPSVGAAYLFDISDLANPTRIKFHANGNGEAGDGFGISVGISGTTVIVGASGDLSSPDRSGAAYLFDISGAGNPEQIAKLPNDNLEIFTGHVSISGTTALVGALSGNLVYIFDISDPKNPTNFVLRPGNGHSGELFGSSSAISGTKVIVGAVAGPDDTDNSGSAFLFDISDPANPTRIELRPDDGTANDWFGVSVAIDGTTAIVGAPNLFNLNAGPGSAYLFDISSPANPTQVKLGVEGLPAGHLFGVSVAISGTTAIIGVPAVVGGSSAYLFDISNPASPTPITRLIPNDDEAVDWFGSSVGTNGEVAVVGASLNDDAGENAGAAYLFGVDTDGDGLLDDWEVNGIPYIDGGGVAQRFMLPGADPLHKDLYVEVDAMTGLNLSDNAVMLLETAFANAPLSNPEPPDGITLHVFRDPATLSLVAPSCTLEGIQVWRDAGYGTMAELGNAALLDAKAMAYRYCIVADVAAQSNVRGCGQEPGDNFVLFVNGLTAEEQAAVFMHELGHNLGLTHAGPLVRLSQNELDDVQAHLLHGKPNYPSIMNYVLTYRSPWNTTFWELDYSRADAGDFLELDESWLNERMGIGTHDGHYKDFRMPYGVNLDWAGATIRFIRYLRLDGSTGEAEFGACQDPSTDFGDRAGTMFQDCDWNVGVEQDLNYFGTAPTEVGIPSTNPSFPQTLIPYDDWTNVSLPLAAALGDIAPSFSFPSDELTNEAQEWIDANFPLPPGVCVADLDRDGQSGLTDFSLFHGCVSGPGQPYGLDCEREDIDVDGDADLADFAKLQASFGCPQP